MDGMLKKAGLCIAALAAAALMSSLPFLSFLFIIPMLLYGARYGKNSGAAAIGLYMVLSLAADIIMYLPDGLGPKGTAAAVFISQYIPLSLSAAGIIWMKTGGSGRLIPRLSACMAPSALLAVIAGYFISTDKALFDFVYSAFGDAFAQLAGPLLDAMLPGVEVSALTALFLIAFASLMLPAVLCGVCASCFVYEAALHSREGGWDDMVSAYDYPPDYIWGLIASMAAVLILHLVSAPLQLEIAVMNIAGIWGIFYAIQGFTVIAYRLRRRNRAVRTTTILSVLILLFFVFPGINIILLLGLPLLGALECFFDLKKKGVDR